MVLAIFLALSGVTPRWSWLLLPIPVVLVGVLGHRDRACCSSALYVRFRDIKPIWEVVLQALFYATPILYPISSCRRSPRRSRTS